MQHPGKVIRTMQEAFRYHKQHFSAMVNRCSISQIDKNTYNSDQNPILKKSFGMLSIVYSKCDRSIQQIKKNFSFCMLKNPSQSERRALSKLRERALQSGKKNAIKFSILGNCLTQPFKSLTAAEAYGQYAK